MVKRTDLWHLVLSSLPYGFYQNIDLNMYAIKYKL